jgi:hypothetical protein
MLLWKVSLTKLKTAQLDVHIEFEFFIRRNAERKPSIMLDWV